MAGRLFQQATQYAAPLAFLLPDPALHRSRWTDLAFEQWRHDAVVRIVRSRALADAWLAG